MFSVVFFTLLTAFIGALILGTLGDELRDLARTITDRLNDSGKSNPERYYMHLKNQRDGRAL